MIASTITKANCVRQRQALDRPIVEIGVAPHPPAGPFSPYSDGEKGLVAILGAFLQRSRLAKAQCRLLFPVTIRGEMPGSAMRGSANLEAIALRRSFP
jgi:hypothetical protein